VFAVAVDLRALRPDTGAVLVSVPMATREVASDQEAKEAAARDVVHKLLAGTGREDCPGALALYRRVFAQWIAELDLGAIMRLEFAQLADAAHDALLAALRQTPQITAVWPREFDSRALSVVDVESRMDAQGLKGAVLKALGGGFTFDHGTAHALQFRPAAGGGPTEPSAGPAGGGGAASRSGLPPWAWALIGAGAVLAVVGAFALGRRGR
jgi:hypothetical protein